MAIFGFLEIFWCDSQWFRRISSRLYGFHKMAVTRCVGTRVLRNFSDLDRAYANNHDKVTNLATNIFMIKFLTSHSKYRGFLNYRYFFHSGILFDRSEPVITLKILLDNENFYKREDDPESKEKMKEYQRNYYLENKDKLRDNKQKYRSQNKDKKKEYGREYSIQNKEKLKEYSQNYYNKNKDKIKESFREYRIENKDKLNEYNRKYYNQNKEKKKELDREYRIQNKEKMKKYYKDYRTQNKEKINEYCREFYFKKNIEKNNGDFVPSYSWQNNTIIKEFFEGISPLLHINDLSDWYRISRSQINDMKGIFVITLTKLNDSRQFI